MKKIRYSTDFEVSRIVMGTMRLKDWNLKPRELLSLMKKVQELGIDTFDLADIYGDYECEIAFGEALKSDIRVRNEIKIISKCGINLLSEKYPYRKVKHYDTSQLHIIESVDNSLLKLNADYIDLLLIHRPDPLMDPEETANALEILRNTGKVLNFGVSNFSSQQFNMLNRQMNNSLVCNQIEISPYRLDAFTSGNLEYLMTNRIPVMAWSPLAGGKLINPNDDKSRRINKVVKEIAEEKGIKNIEQVIYSWLLMHPAKIIPVIGSGNIDRIKLAAYSIKIQLTKEEWFRIYESSIGQSVE